MPIISPTAISPYRIGGKNLRSYWTALKAEMTTPPPNGLAIVYNKFLKTLSDGGVIQKLDRLFLFGLHTNDGGESLLDWVHPSGTPAVLAFDSGGSVPAFTAYAGFNGNVANKSFINTQYNQANSSALYTQNAASLGIYMNTYSTVSGVEVGLAASLNTYTQLQAKRFGINTAALDFGAKTISTKTGLLSLIRKDANTEYIMWGKTKGVDITNTSGALKNELLRLLSGNGGYYVDSQIYAAYIGGFLTEAEVGILDDAFITLRDEVEAYQYSIQNVIALIGDSTTDAAGAAAKLATFMDADTYIIRDIALGGDNISGQKAKWTAIGEERKQIDIVFVMIGLNDGVTPNYISVYQDLINTIRADIGSSKKIVGVTMIPCSRIFSAHYLPLNEAIRGNGATPITGLDAIIDTVPTALNAGDGTLAELYDIGDALHENDLGRQLIADLYDAQIDAFGL